MLSSPMEQEGSSILGEVVDLEEVSTWPLIMQVHGHLGVGWILYSFNDLYSMMPSILTIFVHVDRDTMR